MRKFALFCFLVSLDFLSHFFSVVGWSRLGYATDGGEDDVWPAAKGIGPAHVGRSKEAGHAEKVWMFFKRVFFLQILFWIKVIFVLFFSGLWNNTRKWIFPKPNFLNNRETAGWLVSPYFSVRLFRLRLIRFHSRLCEVSLFFWRISGNSWCEWAILSFFAIFLKNLEGTFY